MASFSQRITLRARELAAVVRAVLAAAAVPILLTHPAGVTHPNITMIGFGLLLISSLVELWGQRQAWLLHAEELVSGLACVLIVGFGQGHVNAVTPLWLGAVACGVLARRGQHVRVGLLLVIGSLLSPIVTTGALSVENFGLILAAGGILLACARVHQEMDELLEQARHEADHDGLTGALVRDAFRARLDAGAAAATIEEPIGLLLIDLDDFGKVNKLYGHLVGDELLERVAGAMASVVGPADVVGRLGGDEFAVLVNSGDPVSAGERIIDALRTGPLVDMPVGASSGVACAPRDGSDSEQLLTACDVALRAAKRAGKGRIEVTSAETAAPPRRAHMHEALDELIQGDRTYMVVQPIVDLATGDVHAFEALARFQTREGEAPSPWFSLAAEFGVRAELELACLKAALALMPGLPAGARLTVNLSGSTLTDARAGAMLAPLDLRGLVIELTENELVRHDAELRDTIHPLLARGARLAVDDMGAGYAGLRQIVDVKPAYLKLDRALIHGVHADPARAALVAALLAYARHVNAQIVAEGVETEAELSRLLSLGVHLAQGYLLGRPELPWPAPIIDRSRLAKRWAHNAPQAYQVGPWRRQSVAPPGASVAPPTPVL